MSRLRHQIAGAVLVLVAGVASAALPQCATGQEPFEVFLPSSGVVSATGKSPGEACARWVDTSNARQITLQTDGMCVQLVSSTSPITYSNRAIRQVCLLEPDETGLTPQKVSDYMALWGAFMLAAVTILGAKALYTRFRVDYEH